MAQLTWIGKQAWEVIQAAKSVALADGVSEILPRHLLQGCAVVTTNLVEAGLAASGLSRDEVERCIQRVRPKGPLPDPSTELRHMSAQAGRILQDARALASEYPTEASGQVAPVHIWASLWSIEAEITRWLVDHGWPEDSVRRLPEVTQGQLPPRGTSHPTLEEGELQVLKKFCNRNLTELAGQGRLSPAWGTDEITDQMLHCLLRKDKRSLVLTGLAGVGKTKLVEDLAWRIAQGNIPELEGCQVFELDLALFTRGTHLAGSRAERWAQLTEILRTRPENLILFIDELHTIVGLPLEGQAMDLANALKPLLVDAKVRIVGATTPEEYRRHIDGDPALARRFTEIKVPEPDKDTVIHILQKVAPIYEKYHGVTYPTDTLVRIYDLARRYLPNRAFPAKAIDLLDQLGVRAKIVAGKTRPAPGPERPIVLPSHVSKFMEPKGATPDATTLAELLKEKVVGQDHAAERLANVVLTSTLGYNRQERRGPRGVVLFLGPPGVGKSYMAQVFSGILFPGRDKLLTLDMTEFAGQHAGEHARWRLLGPPPPYVGWERGGLLASHAQEHPRSVVLVDEFDKAPPDARNVLLRVFDEGEAQDGRGRTVSFREMYFILTANAGRSLWDNVKRKILGFQVMPFAQMPEADAQRSAAEFSEDEIREVLRTDPEERFAPELLSRISQIVMFKELTNEGKAEIVRRKLVRLRECALLEDLVWLEYDEQGLPAWLVAQCGERPDCRRITALFESRIETPLARFRAQWGNESAILRLEPHENEVKLIPEERQTAAARIHEVLFRRVAEVFAQQERRQRQAQATRTRLGTSG